MTAFSSGPDPTLRPEPVEGVGDRTSATSDEDRAQLAEQERAERERAELVVLEKYLPAQLSDAERAAAAVLVRPDRYVFGTGEPETLVAAWHAFALAGEAPPAPSVSQTSTGEDYGNRRHL